MDASVALQPNLESQIVWGCGQKCLVWIGHQKNQVCVPKKLGLVANGVGFESRTLPNSGGVHQPNHQAIGQPLLLQMISGCSGHIVNEGELLVRQCIEEGALSRIGRSKDGHRGGRQQDIKST